MHNVSFNEDYWASESLADFIQEAAKHKWSEQDATVYHNKIRKAREVPEVKKEVQVPKSKAKVNDNQRQDSATQSPANGGDGDSKGNDTGASGNLDEVSS